MRYCADFLGNDHNWRHDHANTRDIIRGMTDILRVALVDDDSRFRASLRLLIDGSPGFACIGDWPTVEAAMRAPSLGTAGVVLLDLHLPGVDGDEGVVQILDRYPSSLVLMLTPIDCGHDSGGLRTAFRRKGDSIPIDRGQKGVRNGMVSAMDRNGVRDGRNVVVNQIGIGTTGLRTGKRVRDLRCCVGEQEAREEAAWQGDGL